MNTVSNLLASNIGAISVSDNYWRHVITLPITPAISMEEQGTVAPRCVANAN